MTNAIQKDTIKHLIDTNVLANQTKLVEAMLQNSISEWLATYKDIENAYHYVHRDTGETLTADAYDNIDDDFDYKITPQNSMSWYLVTDWLANRLYKLGQPVIRLPELGYWWGRTCYGQALEDDYVFEQIAKSLEAK